VGGHDKNFFPALRAGWIRAPPLSYSFRRPWMLSVAQIMLSQNVHLSVCPSVTRRHAVETAKHVKLFFTLVSQTILVFSIPNVLRCSVGDPPIEGVECRGYEKSRFRPVSRFISDMIQDNHRYYRTRIGNCTEAFEWYHFQ